MYVWIAHVYEEIWLHSINIGDLRSSQSSLQWAQWCARKQTRMSFLVICGTPSMTNQFHRWALDSLTAKQLCISRILQDFQDFCSGNVMAGFQDGSFTAVCWLGFFFQRVPIIILHSLCHLIVHSQAVMLQGACMQALFCRASSFQLLLDIMVFPLCVECSEGFTMTERK